MAESPVIDHPCPELATAMQNAMDASYSYFDNRTPKALERLTETYKQLQYVGRLIIDGKP